MTSDFISGRCGFLFILIITEKKNLEILNISGNSILIIYINISLYHFFFGK